MKLCRFRPRDSAGDAILAGVVEADRVHEVTGDWPGLGSRTGRSWPIAEVRLAAPVAPSKIVCVARNYRQHAAELGNPVPQAPLIFLKAPSSVIGPEEAIVIPPDSARVDHEGELGVVIGRRCARLAPEDDVGACVAGYTCLNDVTARDLQLADGLFGRAKSFDTFCPMGPVIETEFDWKQAAVETWVNGERRQHGLATEMIFPVDHLVRWIARIMTLLPGDVIATGTPEGISPLADGDVVEISIEGIGRLRNRVEKRAER
ncbi:MAG TPA: fumarylacetoacetate hydrolase family protein [Candidatus Acidoferrales bacterium]|nr:fumarylacetoacetate hydrolase family protein [Candidatus Acidoferrales bacterium]